MSMINSSSDSINNNNNDNSIALNYNRNNYEEPFSFEDNNAVMGNQNDNNYNESRIDIHNNTNLLNSALSYNINDINDSDSIIHDSIINGAEPRDNSINNENILEENLINKNNQNSFKGQENSKFMQYLINNNLISENNIIENDKLINKEKQYFDNRLNNATNNLKCKSCEQIPNEFFICSYCYSIFCENCLGKDGNNKSKFCINCKTSIRSKEHFIKIPIFSKILSYIERIKENNEKLFNNKMRDNFDKNKILCSEDIHNINKEDFLKINISDFKIDNEAKAVYFCLECQKPFCSDCILNYKLKKNKREKNINNNNIANNNIIEKNEDEENDNINSISEKEKEIINKHKFTHPIFKIDFLKDVGIFDLLYEKSKSENIISNLDLFEQHINERIDNLNKNKQYITSFLDYIKKIYISKIEEVINELKNISKEKNEKIKIIKEKNEELGNFLNKLKTKSDLKNNKNISDLKQFLNNFNYFHKIPEEIKKKSNKYIKFKGVFDLEEITNFKSNINLNTSNFLNNSKIKIKYDKNFDLNIDESENENENKIIEEKKINIIYNSAEPKNNLKNKKENEFSIPILINYNCDKNKFISLSEIPKDEINEKNDKEINMYDFMLGDEEDNESFNSNPFLYKKFKKKEKSLKGLKNGKNYSTEINVNELKKITDDCYDINFEIYNFKIF